MAARLTRLALTGFKSFAEPVTVEILPGLTGVVGPNGCGKSNVVEALRWVMGENSARSLRGGEMDDVIFAGTAHRASRNLAEVTLSLEDAQGNAVGLPGEQELEVARRIERGAGSHYRVNGREVRARDVQTLFADLASGARSSGMISQGRVSALVTARPEERRQILEEAAGITGLHVRRHEAELKLRAAETNLERAEDLRGQLETQLEGLKRQARQAARYRNINGLCRNAEGELLALQKARAEAERAQAKQALLAGTALVAAAQAAVGKGQELLEIAAAALPPLRERESLLRTARERARLTREQIEADLRRAEDQTRAAAGRVTQIDRDLAYAGQLVRDAEAALERVAAEGAVIAEAESAHPELIAAAEETLITMADQARDAERAADRATDEAAQLHAQAQSFAQVLAQSEQAARRARDQLARAEADHRAAEAQLVPQDRLEAAEADLARAQADVEAARQRVEIAERDRAAAQSTATRARDLANQTEAARVKVAAEAETLNELLAIKDGEKWPPMVDRLRVPAGLELALGAALGEELAAAANEAAARHWHELPPMDRAPWPEGVAVLADLVEAPAALARALLFIGVVENDEAGAGMHARLNPGQILVSRGGGVWRWDGYVIRAGAKTAATVRLQQRNRLAALQSKLTEATAAAQQARSNRADADQAERDVAGAETTARNARRETEQRLERTRAAASQLRAQAAAAQSRFASSAEQLHRLRPEAEETAQRLKEAAARKTDDAELAASRGAVDLARQTVSALRKQENEARTARDGLMRAQADRGRRAVTLANERVNWDERGRDARHRVTDLTARRAEAVAEQAAIARAPAEVAARRQQASEEEASTLAQWSAADSAMRAAEQQALEADRAARALDHDLARLREAEVRAEGIAAQADHHWGTVMERLIERFGADAELPEPPEDPTAAAEDRARRKLDRLVKEREEMGPVNLRAELEAAEIEEQMAVIERERAEIGTAIAKLRGSIGHLNREGRERLSAVFAEVDRHFQTLFSRMFGGGRAHLALTGSDDVLEAGLEIYAQPPGKKLSALSLLSGGEQALTALSLIFAVFRCNPAPIAVLDEVDAPLDDANVDRFCNLLEDMVRDTGTRFLVVTHHSLTMSRMDRLYGVTMQERGISRLLSVDLGRAVQMAAE